jgi:hypothetical protein
MSTSTLNIKQENFYVNFDKMKETEWIPATMRLLTLTHGQPGGNDLAMFAKFVSNIPFEATTALTDSHFDNATIWDDLGDAPKDYPHKTQTALKSGNAASAELDVTLYAVLATCVQGSWTAVFDTIGTPLFSRAFATLYRKAQKSILTMKSSAIRGLTSLQFRGSPEQFSTDFQQVAAALATSKVTIDDLLLAHFQLAIAAKNNIAGASINAELLAHATKTLADPSTKPINPIDFVQRHLSMLTINNDTKQQAITMMAEASGAGSSQQMQRYQTCDRCGRKHEGESTDAKPHTKCWAHTNTAGDVLPISTRTAEPPARHGGAAEKDWRAKPSATASVNLTTKLDEVMSKMAKLTKAVAKSRKPKPTVAFASIQVPTAVTVIATGTTVTDTGTTVTDTEPVDFDTEPAFEHYPEILTFMPVIEEFQSILATSDTLSKEEIEHCELQIMQLLTQLDTLFGLAMHTGPLPDILPTIIDSGAGVHLVASNNGQDVTITDASQQILIGGIGGDTMTTDGEGTWVTTMLDSNGQAHEVSHNDAQICNGTARNVLSMGRLVNAGYELHLTQEQSYMVSPVDKALVPLAFDNMDILILPNLPTTTTTPSSTVATAAPKLPRTIQRQLHNSTQIEAAQAVTTHLHILCSHSQDKQMIQLTLQATSGHNYNGHPIRAGFICSTIHCRACDLSKIAKRPLARLRAATATTTATATVPLFVTDTGKGSTTHTLRQRMQQMASNTNSDIATIDMQHAYTSTSCLPTYSKLPTHTIDTQHSYYLHDEDEDDGSSTDTSTEGWSTDTSTNDTDSSMPDLYTSDSENDSSDGETLFIPEICNTLEPPEDDAPHIGVSIAHQHANDDADDESDESDVAIEDVDRFVPQQILIDNPEYQASEPGMEVLFTRPTILQPGSQIFLDSKPYPHAVTGGWKYCLQVVDKSTKREATIDHRTKTSVGHAFQQIIIDWNLHHLGYESCIHLDGCGSNKHVVNMCMKYGLNWCYLPPDEQSLNLAEPYIKRKFDAARATLLQVQGVLPSKYLRQAVHIVTTQNNLRVPPGCTITPLEAWYNSKPNVAFMVEFGTIQVIRKTRDQDKRSVERNAQLLETDIHGNLIKTHNSNTSLRGDDGIFIGYPHDHRLRTHTYLKFSNTDDRESIVTTRSHRSPQYQHHNHHQPTQNDESTSTDSDDDDDTEHTDIIDDDSASEHTDIIDDTTTDSASELSSVSTNGSYSDGETNSDDSVFAGPNSQSTRTETSTPDPLLSLHINQHEQLGNAAHDIFLYQQAPVDMCIAAENLFPDNVDGMHALAAQFAKRVMPVHSDKDIPWHKIIGTAEETIALAAFDAEFENMKSHGFEVIKPGDPDHAKLLKQARPGRVILAKKRADIHGEQRVKARAVELGHLSKSDSNTNTYSPVTSQEVLRAVVLRPGRNNPHPKGPRLIATVDISQAYLQGDDNFAGYVKFLHPLTKEYYVVKLRCPIYGSDKAAKWWFESLRRQFLTMGFVQGFNRAGTDNTVPPEYMRAPAANCPCMFYHPERDLTIIVYVDDVLADGRQEDLDWFFAEFQGRFKTTPVTWLTTDTPIDFIGIIISIDTTMIFLSMQPYIKKALALFGMTDCTPNRLPMRQDITDDTQLQLAQKAEFMQKMGVCHFLASSVALTTKPAASRIGQYMANPTVGALIAINDLLRYHATNSNIGLGAPLIDLDMPSGADAFEISTDADNSSDPSVNNKRRARYGNLIGYKNSPSAIASTGGRASTVSPIICNSKTLGISFAIAQINESHVGLGSGENEIYAMANTINDAIYFSFILEEMGQEFTFPMQIKTDATTAQVFAMGTAMRSRLRHVDQRQWWVQTCRDKRIAELSHEAGNLLKCDVMTKNFYSKPGLFERKRAELQVNVPTSFSK